MATRELIDADKIFSPLSPACSADDVIKTGNPADSSTNASF